MSVRSRLLTSVLCFATACGFPRPADVPEPIACTANEFLKCDGNSLQTCNASGDAADALDCGVAGCNADAKRCNQCVPSSDSCGANPNEIDHCGPDGLPASQDTCALACTPSPSPHCAYLEPRYLPNVCDAPAAMPMFSVTSNVSFDTGLDGNCTGGVVHQEGAADICVVRYDTIHIARSVTLTVSGTRALALVADHELIIDGTLDVSAHGATSGPGGGGITSGDRLTSTVGGGGAGFSTTGGNGGSLSTDGGGGAGGSATTNPSLLTVLIGGGTPTRATGLGPPLSGGGGGAATLIACRGQVTVAGTLSAGGGGGSGGRAGVVAGQVYSGAGGGAGGNVALQGLSIVVTGSIFANGGGGGAGYPGTGPDAEPGLNGEQLATPASGGAAFHGEGAGGAGGWRDAGPTAGKAPTQAGAIPGGGGGSVGFFQAYTPASVAPTLTPASASPAFSTNRHVNTR